MSLVFPKTLQMTAKADTQLFSTADSIVKITVNLKLYLLALLDRHTDVFLSRFSPNSTYKTIQTSHTYIEIRL